jgi:hypothetical protein
MDPPKENLLFPIERVVRADSIALLHWVRLSKQRYAPVISTLGNQTWNINLVETGYTGRMQFVASGYLPSNRRSSFISHLMKISLMLEDLRIVLCQFDFEIET